MPITFRCACGKDLQAVDESAGKKVRCPACGQVADVPLGPPPLPASPIQADPPMFSPVEAPVRREREDDRPRRSRQSIEKASSNSLVWIIVGVSVMSLFCCCGGAGLLIPAVQKVRESAARLQAINNLHQTAITVHVYHDTFKRMPSPDTNGLSWRVQLLPFLEQAQVFNAIDRQQPWDGPANSRLLAKMPPPFVNHLRQESDAKDTYFQYITGPGAIFAGGPSALRDIRDGASETLLIVEATDSVPWAKPADIVYDPNGPLPRLGDPVRGGRFLAAFADGAVAQINRPDDATLRALITAAGGEQVDLNKVLDR